jgi:hypothetical protein
MLSSTASRLIAFAAGLGLVGGAAAGVGAVTHADPPFQDCLAAARAGAGGDAMAAAGHGAAPMAEAVPGADGRRSELAGVTLLPIPRSFAPGTTRTWRFMVTDCKGSALTRFEPENGKRLHLIVVRSDLTHFRHLHPRLHPDGTWSVELATPRPGRYRAIADFVVDGREYVVGTTLTAPGAAAARPLPAPALRGSADRYDVELERPATLVAGRDAQLTFRITRGGRPVRGLQPHLGAYGHLVALHAPDLAYSHVHPDGTDRRNGIVTFDAELHAPGAYRLFLQFRVGGRVHTAAFTQVVAR